MEVFPPILPICMVLFWTMATAAGQDLSCTPSATPCEGFTCRDGSCTRSDYLCDGIADCSDSSDEQGCSFCPFGFHCLDGGCTNSTASRCDGIFNCIDGSDELCCPRDSSGDTSGESSFGESSGDTSGSGSGQQAVTITITPRISHNGGFARVDCSVTNLVVDESALQFELNGVRTNNLNDSRVYTTLREGGDLSVEIIPVILQDNGTQVRCVLSQADGTETLSDAVTIRVHASPPPTVCPPGQSSCLSSHLCLNNNLFCDGIPDCPDGNDESFCTQCSIEALPPPPTPEQVDCIVNGLTINDPTFIILCASEDLSDPALVCRGDCGAFIVSIYVSCNYTFLEEACNRGLLGDPDSTGETNQEPAISDLTPEESQCVNNLSMVRMVELVASCSNADVICNNSACLRVLTEIYLACTIHNLTQLCSNQDMSSSGSGNIPGNVGGGSGNMPGNVGGGSGNMPGSLGGGRGNTMIPFCVGADGQPTQCLDRSQICDGIPDCIDNSDETSGFCIGEFIITPSKSLSVLIGDYISLTCSHIDESLNISYTWTHFNGTAEFRVLSEDSSTLTFPRIMEEDLGRYSCGSLDLGVPPELGALVNITSARPLLKAEFFSVQSEGFCPSQDGRENIMVDILQLLSARFGVYPLGLAASYSAESCDQVAEANPESLPGMYWIRNEDGDPVQVYCPF